RSVSDPTPGTNRDGLVLAHLAPHRHGGVLVPVAGVRNEYVFAEPDVVSEFDSAVRCEGTTRSDHTTISDHEGRVRQRGHVWHVANGHRDVLADERVIANENRLFAEHAALRKRNQ